MKKEVKHKTVIPWNPQVIREMEIEEFKSLCKGDYKKYYKGVSNADIESEYEHLTGVTIKKEKK